jgi:D-sedoheptulose 7-phosphate isomerase
MNSHSPADRARLREVFRDHAAVLAETEAACLGELESLIEKAVACLAGGGKILFFGNGGSAADSQHLAAELSIRFVRNRRALAGLALTTDTSALTACANDFGFEHIFSRQIEALGRPGDVAIGFSTSGNSPNVLRGLATARECGLFAVAFTGASGGALREVADLLLAVPSGNTARIQEMHGLLGHAFCQELEERLPATEQP